MKKSKMTSDKNKAKTPLRRVNVVGISGHRPTAAFLAALKAVKAMHGVKVK